MTVLVERFYKLFPNAQQLYPVRSDTDGAIVYTLDRRRYLKFEMNQRGSIRFAIGVRHDPPDAWLLLCPCGNIVYFYGTNVEQAVLVYLADTMLEEHSVLYRVDETVRAARATEWYQQLQSGKRTVLEVLSPGQTAYRNTDSRTASCTGTDASQPPLFFDEEFYTPVIIFFLFAFLKDILSFCNRILSICTDFCGEILLKMMGFCGEILQPILDFSADFFSGSLQQIPDLLCVFILKSYGRCWMNCFRIILIWLLESPKWFRGLDRDDRENLRLLVFLIFILLAVVLFDFCVLSH